MLRKDSSYREISLTDSIEQKSFLNLARKPSNGEFKGKTPIGPKTKDNKENSSARTHSDTPNQELFFKREIIKSEKQLPEKATIFNDASSRFQSSKTYMECRME